MAQLTKQRRGELLKAVFDVLAEHPEGIAAKDALAEVQSRLELTDYESGVFEKPAKSAFRSSCVSRR
jgi:restriction system protein